MSATSGSLGQLAIVDAHIHLWDLQALSYPWLTTRYDHGAPFAPYHAICRNYLIPDLQQDAANLRLTKAVHINAAVGHPDPVEETAWVQGQADTHGFTLGIIAGMDLRAHTCGRARATRRIRQLSRRADDELRARYLRRPRNSCRLGSLAGGQCGLRRRCHTALLSFGGQSR